MTQQRDIALLIFGDVEVLDFCGPFEVFSVAGRRNNLEPFNVYTVAEKLQPVLARNGLSINPHYTTRNCPQPDILLIPGGFGTRREMNNPALIQWIQERASTAELVLSVCTGALLLAKAGLLDGLKATTHFGALELLREIAPQTTVLRDKRFIDNGKIIVSAGVSAGIDMSLYVVAKLLGEPLAREAARYMEYNWQDV
jgi:transcriptional regulator GlxA family with amidase domain